MEELFQFYQEREPDIKKNTVNWRIFELVKGFVLRRVGRGLFELGKEVPFYPHISEYIIEIGNFIKDRFPYASFCVWESAILNEFAQHLSGHSFVLVDVERDVAESVYYRLKEQFKPIFYRLNNITMSDVLPDFDHPVLVRNLVSEGPLNYNGTVPTVSLEKLLGDIFCDPEFSFLKGSEMQAVYRNVFSKYTVNTTRLLRYAARKGKKKEIKQFINQL